MSSKHVHFYPEIGFHIKDRSAQKVPSLSKAQQMKKPGTKVPVFLFYSPIHTSEPQ
jgi:hypothetical protein